ncbi:phosphotransferase family protein [Aeromicrobium alkaliterrae]|uniref:Phosphotransferase family protein n=1 Tax=Aeromicrobium alkaliterrae TaxID=302168 RepID=A0ABP4W440_9ACTN
MGVEGQLTDGRPLSGGTQNLMLVLTVGGRQVVLRHPPVHRREHSNRSLGREMRVLGALAGTDVPHAPLIGGAEDSALLGGATAFVTGFVEGFNPGDDAGPAAYADAEWRTAATLDVAVSFARLGDLDPDALGLAGLGRPDGFLERQIDLTVRTWDTVAAESGSTVDVLGICSWLRSTLPPASRPGITHGDAHLNNVLLAVDAPRTAAIVDLEMVTVGDPLLDLGWLLACWPDEDEPFTGAALAERGPVAERDRLVEVYATASDRDVDHLAWYTALASVKLAVLLETTYVRSVHGQAPVDIGQRLHRAAAQLLQQADLLRRGRPPHR